MKTSNALFSAPMVRAIRSRRKTKTRRILKPQPPAECGIHYMLGAESWLEESDRSPVRHTWEAWHGPLYQNRPPRWLCGQHTVRSPWGGVGDRLRVRENYRFGRGYDGVKPREVPPFARIHYEADGEAPDWAGELRPSIFLPRWASRLELSITSVAVERLHAITEAEAWAEGMAELDEANRDEWASCAPPGETTWPTGREYFERIWRELNGSKSWDADPWVWVYGFELLEPAGVPRGTTLETETAGQL